jgi:hypothetical protein
MVIRNVSFFRAGSFALACLFATTAQAVVVTVDSTQYNVTMVAGTYTSLSPTLQNQVWWGSSNTALAFANAVGQQGLPNFGIMGPLFAWAVEGDSIGSLVSSRALTSTNIPLSLTIAAGDPTSHTYAVASQVGVPDSGVTIAMLGAALTALVALRRHLT